VKELHFFKLDLRVQSKTFEALHELRQLTGIDANRAIAFLLDAGTVLYGAIKEEMIKKLMDKEKKQ